MARWRHCHLLAVIALTAVLGGPRDVRGEEGGPSSGGPPVVENRLAKERSPYLRQHRTNPVDWYPWSDEAFARARELDRPVFLSVGYAACHWCHVMEHESFEDRATADLLNATFVCVKVDREERPDVDALYMQAVQLFGRGGWPMTVLLMPDGRPFLGATYLPASNLRELTKEIGRLWTGDRTVLERQADHLAERIKAMSDGPALPPTEASDDALLALARHAIGARFDPVHAGYGDAQSGWRPKFPPHAELLWVLEGDDAPADALERARRTLEAMERGGIHDHVVGGFHRYSTDRAWVLPHFEKMLYDNALLGRAYAAAAKRFDAPRLARAARRTFAWIEAALHRPTGGYASSLDADTHGEEGLTITWPAEELRDLLPPDLAAVVFDLAAITVEGNVLDEATRRPTGRNVLYMARPLAEVAERRGLGEAEVVERFDQALEVLAPIRAKRPQPGLDDKVITAWNGLLVSAMARASRDLEDPVLLDRARALATFLLEHARRADGTLLRFPTDSGPEIPGFAEDHVHLVEGLLDLHDVTGEASWFAAAKDLAQRLVDGFEDTDRGGFWTTSDAVHESLLARTKEAWDSPIPSDNGTAARLLVRIAEQTGDAAWRSAARRTLGAWRPLLANAGMAPGLVALYRALDEAREDALPTSVPIAADAQAGTDVVQAKAWLERADAIRESRVRIAVELSLQAGWHVGALDEALGAAATRVRLARPLPGMALGEPRVIGGTAWAGDAPGWEGTLQLEIDLLLAADVAPGPRRLALEVVVQPCDDRGTCLLPATLELPLALRVGEAEGPARHPGRFPDPGVPAHQGGDARDG
ncbi:MAG: thioredoxin domain-containing protein [Planctomycetes bacterium]|nr:thioredoxin domain-containing protein [Planctomycetota bacterium]MCB9826100.1 thioredoxin domain-containing protein [Planctomycetota bacterium]MCB9830744.1 thioredoxin domain-containing protein [Planctomycetota bacterium]MCB9900941.1 thioredoxin domain-containing protein [Planctomycetota bacterium]